MVRRLEWENKGFGALAGRGAFETPWEEVEDRVEGDRRRYGGRRGGGDGKRVDPTPAAYYLVAWTRLPPPRLAFLALAHPGESNP
jgi:hypothetical protein